MMPKHLFPWLATAGVVAGLACLAWPSAADGPAKTPAQATVTVVYSFPAVSADGTNPAGAFPTSVILTPEGGLIGTCRAGGPYGGGTVFQLSRGGAFTLIHAFHPPDGTDEHSIDGSAPLSPLVRAKFGRYYGTTSMGGAGGTGTLFAISPSGKLTTLYSFSNTMGVVNTNADGAQPAGPLVVDAAGDLWGVTGSGGEGGQGTVFSITPSGQLHSLFSFDLSTDLETNSDGGEPVGGLVLALDGSFYGTTARFGPGSAGTIYKITPDGHFTLIYAFMQLDDKGRNPDGATPSGGLTLSSDGAFYGTTRLGGRYGSGTVFRITADGQFELVYTFSGLKGKRETNADGAAPEGSLLLASDGSLYGVCGTGGAGGSGTIFRIDPNGAFQTIYSFSELDKTGRNTEGMMPDGPLVQGHDGALYGVTMAGGTNRSGTVFEIALPASKTN